MAAEAMGARASKRQDGDFEPLLVVAIDFGTTYSGYGFSFRADYDRNPLEVRSQNFVQGTTQSAKVSSSVLFDPEKKFHSFGTEAEDKYNEMCDENRKEARRWFYFQNFKMTLHKEARITRDLVLLDHTKKKGLPALEVFTAAIAFMKAHFLDSLRQKKVEVKDTEIKWVLTVPAIWEDRSRQFMREAAQRAGVPGRQLSLALEPEAASVFCLESYKSKEVLLEPLFLVEPGKKFMLVDCGGGTIDISVFEIQDRSSLRHLHRPGGTADGGTQVDKAFKDFLYKHLGFDGVNAFDRMDNLQLFREFEKTKRSLDNNARMVIKVPESLKLLLETTFCSSDISGVSFLKGNLMVDKSVYMEFFQTSTASIIKTMKDIMDSQNIRRVDAILLAGGFSESVIIQEAVKEAFPRDLVLVAPFPSAAVLTGAVMYGHNPDVITTRVSAFTYGVSSWLPFREGVHDEQHLKVVQGLKMSSGCFDVFIETDQEVEVNKLLPYRVSCPASADQKTMYIAIYRTKARKPVHVREEGCLKIATVKVDLGSATPGKERMIRETMQVGGTELKFIAIDDTTEKEFSVCCDFLSKQQ